jgi:hypothetical protein
MALTILWVTRGPRAGEFIQVPYEDAVIAESEGWGQITEGRDGVDMRKAEPGPHKAAQAYLDRKEKGYPTREFRAGESAEPKRDAEEPKRRVKGKQE